MSEAKTFRGTTLEELLPKIRAELGPAAVVTRRREGIVGGIGGFFGKRCLEVEARSGDGGVDLGPFAPADDELVPAGGIDFYDTGDEQLLRPGPASAPALFSGRLAEVFDRFQLPLDGAVSLRTSLSAAGIPAGIADAVVAEAEHQLAPFAPDVSLAAHGRAALARRIRVRHAGRGRRRVIALVGAPGAGRTSVAIALCRAYANAGTRVAALSLEGVREVLELAQATGFETGLEVADTPEALGLVQRKLKTAELVVVDTPPVDPSDSATTDRLATLLAALAPTETHLVVSSNAVELGKATLDQLRSRSAPDRLVITGVDGLQAGRAVALALAERLPVSYVHSPRGLEPAEPNELAKLVL